MSDEVVTLVLRMARENPTWGFDKIEGAMENLGLKISDTTVGNILRDHGIEPAPDRKRKTTWKTFLRAHWDVLGSIDFTTIEVWTQGGLVTFYVLVAMHLNTRQIKIAGITSNPDGDWIRQATRELTNGMDGFFMHHTHVLVDRDTKFLPLRDYLNSSTDMEPIVLPPRSPNLNAHLERFMRSIKSECLDRMIFFGRASLQRAIGEYTEHYHHERNHQGLGNRIPFPGEGVGTVGGDIRCSNRLGGLLRYYHRDVA